MTSSAEYLSPSEAARQLGVSPKALRIYEQRRLVTPARTAAGWRAYGPQHMARAVEIVALRALGFTLAQTARTLAGDPRGLEPALAAHQAALEAQAHSVGALVEKVRALRADIARGRIPSVGELAGLVRAADPIVAFDLPYPWGGERFELRELQQLTFIVGPLGSGKTRLALRIAETLPGATFLGLDRAADGGVSATARIDGDPLLKARVDQALAWLIEEGATATHALIALLVGLEDDCAAVVVDMVEHGLDQASQEALIAYLRRRGRQARPLILMTRSTAILDLADVGPDEAILFCPANHSPPYLVAAQAGAPGYEAVASCLASPDVRARTEGVIAWRPQAA